MNININDNGYWLGFWIIVSVTLISLSVIEEPRINATSKNRDVIAQRIEAIEDSSILSSDKAALIKQLISSQTNTISEIVLEQK
jgi:hypothetical protein